MSRLFLNNNAKTFDFTDEFYLNLGDTDRIIDLAKEGVNMSLRFDNGQTPIHLAGERGNE